MTKVTIKIDDKYISVVEYLRKKYKLNFEYFFLYGFSVMIQYSNIYAIKILENIYKEYCKSIIKLIRNNKYL